MRELLTWFGDYWKELTAVLGAAGGILGLLSWVWRNRKLQQIRTEFAKQLADHKAKLDGGLAEQKSALDKSLAEHKLGLDRNFADHKAELDKDVQRLVQKGNAELEALRDDLADRREEFARMSSALASSYSSAHPRVTHAFEKLWQTVLHIKGEAAPYLLPYSMLLREEVAGFTPEKVKAWADKLIPVRDEMTFMQQTHEARKELELDRPFISPKLWSLFVIHSTIAHRIGYKVISGIKQGKFPQWDQNADGSRDKAFDILPTVLPGDFLDSLEKTLPVSAPQRILWALEEAILEEMSTWIFGKQLVQLTLAERARIEAARASVSGAPSPTR